MKYLVPFGKLQELQPPKEPGSMEASLLVVKESMPQEWFLCKSECPKYNFWCKSEYTQLRHPKHVGMDWFGTKAKSMLGSLILRMYKHLSSNAYDIEYVLFHIFLLAHQHPRLCIITRWPWECGEFFACQGDSRIS